VGSSPLLRAAARVVPHSLDVHMPDAAVTIIGGGVVGLAIAAELASRFSPLFVLERNAGYGQETSSRNSEVIHAGIYYTPGSLKARLCVEGREMLYRLCEAHSIPHRRVTKIITATTSDELPELDRLYKVASANGVPLEFLTAAQVHALEPHISTVGGLLSPTTGIISAHGLMDYYYHTARNSAAEIQLQCTVTGIDRTQDGYRISIDENGQRSSFTSEWVINAAGLECDTIASYAGIDINKAGYRLHYCKGSYFALPGSMRSLVSRLVYPVPTKYSLGVHVVIDLGGRLKFGPDAEYLPDRNPNYAVDPAKRHTFAESVRRILPTVSDDDLTPDMSGIRPKTQGQGDLAHDFTIVHESVRGLPGLINLIGMESPALTASAAIARHVAGLINAS
jgi:L-2-hydroxyglutarate oxidase LhgO